MNGSKNNGASNDSLDWQAWCYVSGEMSQADRTKFETGFADPTVCEAVARQTELFATLEQVCEQELAYEKSVVVVAADEHANVWAARGLMLVAASLLWGCLSLGLLGLQEGSNPQVRLGELWVGTQPEEIDETDLLIAAVDSNGNADDEFDGLVVPEWMAIGVQSQITSE